jgi:hypothetical protein
MDSLEILCKSCIDYRQHKSQTFILRSCFETLLELFWTIRKQIDYKKNARPLENFDYF